MEVIETEERIVGNCTYLRMPISSRSVLTTPSLRTSSGSVRAPTRYPDQLPPKASATLALNSALGRGKRSFEEVGSEDIEGIPLPTSG